MAKRTEVGLGPSPFKYAEEIDRHGSCTPPSTIVRDPFVDDLLHGRNYGLDVAHLCIGVSRFPFVKTALRPRSGSLIVVGRIAQHIYIVSSVWTW